MWMQRTNERQVRDTTAISLTRTGGRVEAWKEVEETAHAALRDVVLY